MKTIKQRDHAERNDDAREGSTPVPSGYKDSVRYRRREAGTGYGRSSGYARNRTYAAKTADELFRCG